MPLPGLNRLATPPTPPTSPPPPPPQQPPPNPPMGRGVRVGGGRGGLVVVVVVVVMLVVLVVVPTYSDREGVNLDTFSDTMYHVPCTSVTVIHKKLLSTLVSQKKTSYRRMRDIFA